MVHASLTPRHLLCAQASALRRIRGVAADVDPLGRWPPHAPASPRRPAPLNGARGASRAPPALTLAMAAPVHAHMRARVAMPRARARAAASSMHPQPSPGPLRGPRHLERRGARVRPRARLARGLCVGGTRLCGGTPHSPLCTLVEATVHVLVMYLDMSHHDLATAVCAHTHICTYT